MAAATSLLDESTERRHWLRTNEGGDETTGGTLDDSTALASEGETEGEGEAEGWGRRALAALTAPPPPAAALVSALAAAADTLERCEAALPAAPPAPRTPPHAPHSQRKHALALLETLQRLLSALDCPVCTEPLPPLDTDEGRRDAARRAHALLAAGQSDAGEPWWERMAAVRERRAHLTRCRARLAAHLAKHLNNALVGGSVAAAAAGGVPAPAQLHAALAPLAPLMHALAHLDERAHAALGAQYAERQRPAYEREVALALSSESVEGGVERVEAACDAEQRWLAAWAGGAATQALLPALFPDLAATLVAFVQRHARNDQFGAVRALSVLSKRVLGAASATSAGGTSGGSGGGSEGWVRGAVGACAVAAKRELDRALDERIKNMPQAAKAIRTRPHAGLLPPIVELREWCQGAEAAWGREARRADLDRALRSLTEAAMRCVEAAEHPRTPPALIHAQNYHELHDMLSALHVPALDPLRKEVRTRYQEAVRRHAAHWAAEAGPLHAVARILDGARAALAEGVPAHEVCYRRGLSRQEVKKALGCAGGMGEVRAAVRAARAQLDRQLGAESPLVPVVWGGMQLAVAEQAQRLDHDLRLCYPPLTLDHYYPSQHILDAFQTNT